MRPCSRIYVSLALGTLTTVAVAWFCALRPSSNTSIYGINLNINEHDVMPARRLLIQQNWCVGRRWIRLVTWHAEGPDESEWHLLPELRPDIEEAMNSFPEARGESAEASRELDAAVGNVYGWPSWPSWLPDIPRSQAGLADHGCRAAGWPLLALRSFSQSPDPNVPPTWTWSWRWLTADRYSQTDEPQMGAVPLSPIPLNFGTDALFFAGAWWIILAGPRDVKRWRRRRGGLCEYCAYSLTGLTATQCPECGTHVCHAIQASQHAPTPMPPSGSAQ